MNTKIDSKGFSSLIFFTSESMFLGVGITQILNSAGNDSILSVLLGGILALIFLFFIYIIYNYEKDYTFFKKSELLFGKLIGNFINIFLTIIFAFYFLYSLWSVNFYIQNKYLDNTPNYIIIILFLIPVVLLVSKGNKVITKVSIILFFITLFEMFFSINSLYMSIDLDNLKPLFNMPFSIILKNAFTFMSYFSIPTFLIMNIPKNTISNKNLTKYVILFYIFCIFHFFLLFFFIIGIYGIDLAKLFYYPEFTLMKKINYFDFIQHIENILSAQWIYSIFISTVMSLKFLKDYLNHIKIKKNYLYYIFIIISLFISTKLFKDTTIGYQFIKKYFIYIYSIPIIIISIVMSILILLKKKN